MKKLTIVIACLIVIVFGGCQEKPLKKPDIKREVLPEVRGPVVIGSFDTMIQGSNPPIREARIINIKKALEKLNGTVILPGEIFSFNRAIGKTSIEEGFVEAPIIADDGSITKEPGGGICQLATTLYNAVLKAGLKVVERHPHSQDVDYVRNGNDATVYDEEGKDFRFKNILSVPVTIKGSYNEGLISVFIYEGVIKDKGLH